MQTFGLCVIAFLVIVALHLIGLHVGARFARQHRLAADLRILPFQYTVFLIVAVMALLFTLHLLTNFAWGLFMYMADVLKGYRQCVFYSLENYTSLGLTRVDVPPEWRMLAPMISLSGVFCLAWSTALLVSVFNRLYAITEES
ncbi:hypothetical protein [Aestuariivirga sp.]|uniref:hypothetical protein n=1 Tax=Aestuariivirga sp. TaxID=2650926 RepID=UPI003BAA3ED1